MTDISSNDLPLVSVNGQLGASISPFDRGFAYGDGVFETCRLYSGRLPLWPYHLARLRSACERLQIPFDEAELDRYLQPLLAPGALRLPVDAVLKLVVTRGVPTGQARGYRLPAHCTTTYCISIAPAGPVVMPSFREGAHLRLCQLRLGDSPALAGLKHLNRLEQVLARREWADEFDEGLLLDCQGNLVEATAANLFWCRAGHWYTPALARAGVAGVLREYLLQQLLPQLQAPVALVSADVEELADADEVFICNSLIGIWPVLSLSSSEKNYVWKAGAQTRYLQQQLLANLELDS